MELAGRVALATGGSGDLGSAICRALALQQVNVTVTMATKTPYDRAGLDYPS